MPPALSVEFRPRYRRCEVRDGDAAKLRAAIEQLPGAMAGQFHNLNISPVKQTRHKGVFRLKLPPFRIIFQVVGKRVFVLELDRRDDNTYKHIDRLIFARSSTGVAVIEAQETPSPGTIAPRTVVGRRPSRGATEHDRPNPLMPFSEAQLADLGATEPVARALRQMHEDVDVIAALAELGVPADHAELLADAWSAPAKYLEIFDSGRTPSPEDARIELLELERRLASPDSSASVAAVAMTELEQVLAAPIDDWMWFLHPSQSRIVRHLPTGPSRVRGGPGTGKTVAALHRARFLLREGFAEDVLLTTFVAVLPATWRRLLSTFAPEVHSSITCDTVDRIAYAIVRDADGPPDVLTDEQDRLPFARRAAESAALRRSPSWLLEELDTVIAGRAITTERDYLDVARSGRGDAVSPAERTQVFAAASEYQRLLAAASKTDFAHMRLRALELATAGAGPRFGAIIVDEAQDLTLTHVRLLLALDRHRDHRCFMVVGDGQQAIYPGGFSLRSAGLEVRGRSFVLRTNWRNTQRIAETASLVLGDQRVRDLEREDAGDQDAAPPRRLGSEPELHLVSDASGSDELLSELLPDLLDGLRPEDVAVLGRTKRVVQERGEQVCRRLKLSTARLTDLRRDPRLPGIRVGTFEYSKGLEFKVVVLVGPTDSDWKVSPYWLGPDADLSEWDDLERRRLFVAMTRARDRLVVVATPGISPPLGSSVPAFAEYDWR